MRSQSLTKGGLYRFLPAIEATPGDSVTLYIEPARFPGYLDSLSLEPKYRMYTDEIREAVSCKAVIQGIKKRETGAVVFWGGAGNKHIILPPYIITESKVSTDKIDVSVLRQLLGRRYVTGVVLVTWGSYAIGVFDADSLVASKKGTGYIHKEHRKGGRSEKRFARRTEEQKKDFLRKVSNRIDENLGDFILDDIFFGGNRLIIKPLLQECKYLQSRAHKISPRILNVRYADKEALLGSLAEITQSLVFTF